MTAKKKCKTDMFLALFKPLQRYQTMTPAKSSPFRLKLYPVKMPEFSDFVSLLVTTYIKPGRYENHTPYVTD